MDIERIEQALRAGPVDEPRYIPGSHRATPRRFAKVLAITAIISAISFGLVLGVALSTLDRGSPRIGAVDAPALARQLPGRWVSEEITRDRWIAALVGFGHDIDDIDNFLAHFDPIERSTHYEIVFAADRLAISDFADGLPRDDVASGPYRIDADGALHYDDRGCFVSARFRIDGDRLTFDRIATESCGADERIANTAFFNLGTYTRVAP